LTCVFRAGNCSYEEKLFQENDPIPMYVDALCNWRRSDDLLEVIYNWIQKGNKVLACWTLKKVKMLDL
jgi:hypothetical protein